MRFALFPIKAFARFTHDSSLMTILIKCDEKNIIYDAVNCFLGVFYFMRQGCVRVRGHAKVLCHLMFGLLALTANQMMILVT
ncbi:MAG: hypothetical protein CG441_1222 [Methylococcaceae bacterium NSM2-1]|jgi:hypothetical protein|nr:MAG: hypothetical protein CG441_1222 [Methylococcaceae bacterium NSM2-1]